MENWNVLDSKYILQRPWATLRVDRLEMPNGQIKEEYYVLEYPTWVNMIAITEDEQLIFVKQYRHGAKEVMIELSAGVVEAGEDPEFAARRELLEETGYAFKDCQYICKLYANPATSGNLTYTYLLTAGQKIQEQELDDSEDIEVVLMNKEEAMNFLFENKIGQALHSSAMFYTFKTLGWI